MSELRELIEALLPVCEWAIRIHANDDDAAEEQDGLCAAVGVLLEQAGVNFNGAPMTVEAHLSAFRAYCALAALDASEVPTQPGVCRWEGGGLLIPACSPQHAWSRDIITFKFCPDCGRKIEVTHE